MPLYRRRKSLEIWHWCTTCPDYPTSDYEQEYHPGTERPSIGEFCKRCEEREKHGTCH